MFKVLRNGLLRYILHTCPKLWCNLCSNLWCNPLDNHEWNGLAKESKLESSKMSLGVRLWKTKNLMFFLDFQLWNHRFPVAKRQFSSWSHGPATRNTCASTSGLFKSTTNTTFQVPELRITKKRNVVHARAPYQPATLFFTATLKVTPKRDKTFQVSFLHQDGKFTPPRKAWKQKNTRHPLIVGRSKTWFEKWCSYGRSQSLKLAKNQVGMFFFVPCHKMLTNYKIYKWEVFHSLL